MWIIDLWRFEGGEAHHEASSEAEDRESALDQARNALVLDPSAGATVYEQTTGAGFPMPKPGEIVVEG